ncbi:hypothetical protein BH11MYX3_BH11MYX3_24280 [soil metagenome]
MSNVLVNFRLNPEQPVRLKWMATDGVPGDGYKAQITAVKLGSTTLQMDSSAILEQTAPDPAGGIGAYLLTFNGMVGYAEDHPDRAHVDKLTDAETTYDLEFVHEDGRVAVADQDYRILERPIAMAHKISARNA